MFVWGWLLLLCFVEGFVLLLSLVVVVVVVVWFGVFCLKFFAARRSALRTSDILVKHCHATQVPATEIHPPQHVCV